MSIVAPRGKSSIPATLLVLWMISPALAERFVRIPADVDLSALASAPIAVLDYGSFRWTTWDDRDFPDLSALGAAIVEQPDFHQIRVPGFRFDPLVDGEPELSAGATLGSAGPALRLVQLEGPPKDLWYRRIESSGATILQYYPHNTY